MSSLTEISSGLSELRSVVGEAKELPRDLAALPGLLASGCLLLEELLSPRRRNEIRLLSGEVLLLSVDVLERLMLARKRKASRRRRRRAA